MTDKACRAEIRRIDRIGKYGYWTGKFRLDPIIPDWSGMSWYKKAWKRLNYTALYEFINDPDDPRTYHHPDGYLVRPDNHFITDMGSVPKILQGLLPILFSKDLWLGDYCMHDSGYKHGGLWFAKHDVTVFIFCKMPRSRVDEMLDITIHASGGGCLSSAPIWFGVRIGGWMSFDKGDLRHLKENQK